MTSKRLYAKEGEKQKNGKGVGLLDPANLIDPIDGGKINNKGPTELYHDNSRPHQLLADIKDAGKWVRVRV